MEVLYQVKFGGVLSIFREGASASIGKFPHVTHHFAAFSSSVLFGG